MNFISRTFLKCLIVFLILLQYKTQEIKKADDFSLENNNIDTNINEEIKNDEDNNVVFAFYIFRHGARGPNKIGSDSKDMIGATWPSDGTVKDGFTKDLTPVGLRQHYILGLEQRNLYKNLLSDTYKPGDIYFMSSTRARAAKSLLAHQQGLMKGYTQTQLGDKQIELALPPVGEGESNPQEIIDISKESKFPVGKFGSSIYAYHMFKDDNRFIKFEDNCYGIKNSDEDALSNELNLNFTEFNDKWKSIIEKMGFTFDSKEKDPKKQKENRKKLSDIRDAFVSDYYQNNVPSNIFSSNQEKNEFLSDSQIWISKQKYLQKMKSDDGYNARILTSRLFDLLLNTYFANRVKLDKGDSKGVYDYKNPKLLVYSMHDTDLEYIMGTLESAFQLGISKIEFAAAYNFELIRVNNRKNNKNTRFLGDSISEDENNYDILIRYNLGKIYQTTLPNFREKLMKKMIFNEEIDNFCRYKSTGKTICIVLISVLSVGVFLMLIYLICLIVKKRKRNNDKVNNFEIKESLKNLNDNDVNDSNAL